MSNTQEIDDRKGDAFLAIMMNAIRLQRDASLLLDAERWASAIALAVLSLEEVGKLLMLGEEGPDAAKLVKLLADHGEKRKMVGEQIRAEVQIDAVAVLFEDIIARDPAAEGVPLDEIDAYIAAKSATDRRARFVMVLRAAKPDPKNEALYVDVDHKGTWAIRSTPETATEETARDWVQWAQDAINIGTPTGNYYLGE